MSPLGYIRKLILIESCWILIDILVMTIATEDELSWNG